MRALGPFPSTSVGALGLFTFLPQSTVHNLRIYEQGVSVYRSLLEASDCSKESNVQELLISPMLQDFKPLLQDLILLLVLSNNPGEQQLSLPELLKLAELLMQDRRKRVPSVQNSIRSSMWISIRSRFKQLLNPGRGFSRYFIKVQDMFLCRGQWNVSRPDNF